MTTTMTHNKNPTLLSWRNPSWDELALAGLANAPGAIAAARLRRGGSPII